MPLNKTLTTFKLSFGSWLFLIALLVALPQIVISLYSTDRYSADRVRFVELQLHEKAENIALQQDAYLRKIENLLAALAHSPYFKEGDIPKMYLAAKLLQESTPEMSAISLVDANDNVLFLTLAPLGKMVPVSQIDSVHEAFQTGRPNISNTFVSPSVGEPVYAVNLPVFRDGRVVFCLRGIFRVQNLHRFIDMNDVPENWIASVVDRKQVLALRNVDAQKFVGQTASNGLVNAIQHKQTDAWTGTTLEGIKTRSVYKPVGSWGWSVGLGVPEDLLLGPLREELLKTAAFALVLLILITGMALALGYWLSRHLKLVAEDAQLALTNQPARQAASASTHITELDQLRDSITRSDTYRQLIETEVAKRTEELSLAQQQLTAFAIQQEESIENERVRIAREVHDQLGAIFTGVSLMVHGLDNIDPVRKTELLQALHSGLKTAQRITSELRPPLLDELGLGSAVREMAKATLGQAGIVCNVELKEDGLLNAQQRIGCYRIIQEAITNVLRHSQATSCSILGGATPAGEFVVVVADNGNVNPADLSQSKSWGVKGMQERAKLMGGTLTLQPIEQGLSVRVVLPLTHEAPAIPPTQP